MALRSGTDPPPSDPRPGELPTDRAHGAGSPSSIITPTPTKARSFCERSPRRRRWGVAWGRRVYVGSVCDGPFGGACNGRADPAASVTTNLCILAGILRTTTPSLGSNLGPASPRGISQAPIRPALQGGEQDSLGSAVLGLDVRSVDAGRAGYRAATSARSVPWRGIYVTPNVRACRCCPCSRTSVDRPSAYSTSSATAKSIRIASLRWRSLSDKPL